MYVTPTCAAAPRMYCQRYQRTAWRSFSAVKESQDCGAVPSLERVILSSSSRPITSSCMSKKTVLAQKAQRKTEIETLQYTKCFAPPFPVCLLSEVGGQDRDHTPPGKNTETKGEKHKSNPPE